MNKEDFVYSRIGMALVSAQRVEFISKTLLDNLSEFDTVYNLSTQEFLSQSKKAKKARKTLGTIFKLLKLNPNLSIENEFDSYLKKRNLFVHEFWQEYLNSKSDEQIEIALEFLYDFGKHSDRLSKFFQGFTYQLITHISENFNLVVPNKDLWKDDNEYFIESLQNNKLE